MLPKEALEPVIVFVVIVLILFKFKREILLLFSSFVIDIKFSNEEVNIDIYLLKELNNAVIEISDRGLGFDNEKAADALKLFTQINRETGEQQGSGSGLFICSEYIKAHGGKIEIQSREGGGTTVRITIPCE